MTTSIQRDPFARANLERDTIPARDRKPCAWCGCGVGRFAYRWVADSIRPKPAHAKPVGFCSVGCCRAYRGGEL